MYRLFFLSILFSFMCFGVELDAYLKANMRSMLKTERDQMLTQMGMVGKQLILVEKDKSVMRYQQKKLGYSLTFGGHDVVEAVFTFGSKKHLQELSLSMYNRGDCGAWDVKEFQVLVSHLKRTAVKLTKDKHPRTSQRRLKDAVINESIWNNGEVAMVLRWCGKGEDLEYVTVLFMSHKSSNKLTRNMGMRTRLDVEDLPKQVKHDKKKGASWLDVPMVDQGGKGYCVAATFARILKYYKAEVDQHVLAQLLESDAAMGTDIRKAYATMKKCGDKFDVTLRELYTDTTTEDPKQLQAYVSRYNQMARKAKKPTVDIEQINQSGMYPLQAMSKIMDRKLFIECRCYRRKLSSNMMPMVKRYIDKGLPLFWVVPGHARLIVGYRGESTILYSDSWGAGHELNEMPVKEAVALSQLIYLVTPK